MRRFSVFLSLHNSGYTRRALFVCSLLIVAGNLASAQDVPSEPQALPGINQPPDSVNVGEIKRDRPKGLLELILANPATVALSVSPFLLASLIALWFGTERIVLLRRGRVIPKPFVSRFLDLLKRGQLDAPHALELCEENGSPVAHVFSHAIRKWGKPSVEVEQAIIDGGERQVAHLRKHLRILNGVATVTPLIGLLGTVLGMMIAFFHLTGSSAAGRADELAVGIVTALSTTALGLSIAIPSLILYMYLTSRIDSLVMEMDDLAQQVIHCISAEGLASRPIDRPAPRARPKPEAVVT